ncbi:hypothetical protein PTNB85_10235 [Pyrenophora teres f. teres]|nr:hypothetical protein PTNB85_10235 [Pyrenophora teres f. teres]KAE8823174.1 hypothetical protein HRS9139_09583 [Pyrenophora teres f. teres]KAE8854347.1 hypothetical protein PTNB29_09703 [Pyrenophora teres f. teres]
MIALKLDFSAIIIGSLLAIPVLTAPSGDAVGAHAPTIEDIIPREYIEECPENTVCVQLTIPNEVDVENEEIFIEDIICQPSTPPRQDVRTTRRQYGYRPYKAAGKEIVGFPVEVLEDNPHAVVSADILSSDRTFVIKPISTLTANLRGFDLKLCQQDPGNTLLNSRQCVATGRPKNLRSGQFIDFTFALSPGQDGFLFYSIA